MNLLKAVLSPGILLNRQTVFCRILSLVICMLLIMSVQGLFAAEKNIQFPKTIAWSAYPTGTGGYSQAVAIGNILQRQYGVNLRVIPGRNDVSRLATLRAGRVHFSAGGSESVYALEGILKFASKICAIGKNSKISKMYIDK